MQFTTLELRILRQQMGRQAEVARMLGVGQAWLSQMERAGKAAPGFYPYALVGCLIWLGRITIERRPARFTDARDFREAIGESQRAVARLFGVHPKTIERREGESPDLMPQWYRWAIVGLAAERGVFGELAPTVKQLTRGPVAIG